MPGYHKSGPLASGLNLAELLNGIEHEIHGEFDTRALEISAVTADSRLVGPGSLFVAVCGEVFDGHDFVETALQAGAAAIVAEFESEISESSAAFAVPFIGVADSKTALGLIAARFHGSPADSLNMVGITGTNGKTTVSYLMEHVLTEAGFQVGVIGTVDYRYHRADHTVVHHPAPFTTPDPVRLHATLKEMADNGVSHVIMEVSSHALAQKRLGPILFSTAVFTNLSQDHLDYHKTMADYFSAKCLLFSDYMAPGAPVVVMDSEEKNGSGSWSSEVIDLCGSRGLSVIRCGDSADANYQYLSSSLGLSGMSIVCRDEAGMQRLIHSPLVGRFNVENLLVSLAALVSLGVDTDRVCELLTDAVGAPGRLQRVALPTKPEGQPTVLVDYAHTPDALEKVLQTARQLPHGRLYCVFGCGGDRDRSKRPLMGLIAATLSDVAVVTDDNPRSEDPDTIRADIRKGIEQAGRQIRPQSWLFNRPEEERGCVEIGSRMEAIRAAVTVAGHGDIVLIAGKGHEQYQITPTGRKFFDDCLAAQEAGLLWDIETLADACRGEVVSRGTGSGVLASVSTDSRNLGAHDIFVALKGDSFDGHDFLDKAVEKGAGCLVVSDSTKLHTPATACVRVGDTLEALGKLAGWRRQAVKELQNPVVVGLTGSCGKTTVKEMTAAIFARHWPEQIDKPAGRVLKTEGNFNNLVGLPLSLLPVSAKHRGVVLEMGMNRPGEIAGLTRIADPTIACIVNIHGAHLEGLGSIEGVAKAKGELFENTREDALHVINLDDERVVRCGEKYPQATITFAVSEAGRMYCPDVWADQIEPGDQGSLSLTLHVREQQERLVIQAPGLHNSSNACAAAAIALGAGIDFETIISGLKDFRSAANRMERLRTPKGINILNDTYNANPASMASALETISRIPAAARVAILGDMLELGGQSGKLHEDLGLRAAGSGLDYLAVLGGFSEMIRSGASSGGMDPDRVIVFQDKQRVVDWVAGLLHSGRLQAGDWVLVKASRGLALDTVVGQLLRTC